MPTPKLQRAFTLVELMVVVAVIAVLAAILIPNFLHARAQSTTSACEGNEKMIATALEQYSVDHNGNYLSGAVSSTLIGTPYLDVNPVDPVNQSLYTIVTNVASAGAYEIRDQGGHDLSTMGGLPGGPGTGKIYYDQNSGLQAQ